VAFDDPLPLMGPDTRFFWQSGGDGVLRVLRCGACGYWNHPPYPRCAGCGSEDVAPTPVAGTGTVYSFTVRPLPEPPLVIAIVELDEQPGLRLTTNITDADARDVRVGQRVTVHFRQRSDVWLPLFRPVDA
jgi:uncharacterized OB-fold protein